MITVCKACFSPVYRSGSKFYHDIRPRMLATIAREVTNIDEQLAKTPGVGAKRPKAPEEYVDVEIEGL